MNFDEIQDDAISYAKHIIPIAAFLVIALLSIPGWIICCFCCCCNCCCCCCCKKPGCKIPCFIFTYVFYALAVAICFYGLSQTSHIFVGLADTECSILKFFDEVLDGELKQTKPRWAGINGINGILDDIITQVDDLKNGAKDDLDREVEAIETQKTNFVRDITQFEDKFHVGDNGNADYKDNFKTAPYNFLIGTGENTQEVSGTYVLDMIKFLGKYDNTEEVFKPANSFLDIWSQEYKIISDNADGYLEIAQNSFSTIIDTSSGDIIGQLNQGKDMLDNIKDTFSDIKSEIADSIVEYSYMIDEYGKLGSNLVFGVLALMNIALAVLVLLICFCSGKMCTNCCCCRCICKFFTHLLWNVLALLMIITFLVGFLFSLIGTIGYDAMSIISYVVSEENLKDNENGILVDKLAGASSYLDRCINGDGKIEEAMGIDFGDIDSLDQINTVQDQIEEAKRQFTNLTQCFAFNLILDELNKRTNLTTDKLMLVKKTAVINDLTTINPEDTSNFLPFDIYLNILNNTIETTSGSYQSERWKVGVNGKACVLDTEPTHDSPLTTFDPLKCDPRDRPWIRNLDSDGTPNSIDTTNPSAIETNKKVNIKASAKILSDTLKFLKDAKTTTADPNPKTNFLELLDELKDHYKDNYLHQYILTLDDFGEMINNIVGKLKEYTDKENGGVFGFINGKFIGTNLKIILKYLKSALGTDIKNIGICLLIVGCALALSISSTILLIVVINVDIDKNKENAQIPEYKVNSVGRVIQYQ